MHKMPHLGLEQAAVVAVALRGPVGANLVEALCLELKAGLKISGAFGTSMLCTYRRKRDYHSKLSCGCTL